MPGLFAAQGRLLVKQRLKEAGALNQHLQIIANFIDSDIHHLKVDQIDRLIVRHSDRQQLTREVSLIKAQRIGDALALI